MEDNKELVYDETLDTENTEETAEETTQEVELKYSEEDFNRKFDEVLPKKLARKEAKVRKEYEKKYGQLEAILKSGLKVDTIEEATEQLRNFYSNEGVKIPEYTGISDSDLSRLGRDDAEELIEELSFEELEEEANRLSEIGFDNMGAREKAQFMRLGQHLSNQKELKMLSELGITAESLEKDKDFQEFKKIANPNLTIKEVYENYKKYRHKPSVEPIGSMKGTTEKETAIKEFYTRDEALQFTREDYEKNPKLFEAVENSSYKW